jgi:hypothetical protein
MAEETNKPTTPLPLPVAVGEPNHDELLKKMDETRKKWMEEDGDEADDTDRLLNEAIEMAVQQGRGWSPGEKESYMAKILDDDFIPPIFAENMEELEKTGLAEAFSSLQYDDAPSIIMLDLKKKGTDAFLNGKRSQVNNVQYYRDAINHYYEAFAWAQRIEPIEHQGGETSTVVKPELATDDPQFKEAELDEIKSNLCANAALAHMQLKNWGYVREDSKKVSSKRAVKFPEQRVCPEI